MTHIRPRLHIRLALAAVMVALAAAAGGACDDSSTPVPDVGDATGIPPRGTPGPPDTLSVGFVDSSDSTLLLGRIFGDENPTMVILSHMRPNDQTAWYPFAEQLANHGYAVLTFDFRGYGNSPTAKDDDKLDDDLTAALSFIRDRAIHDEIFLVGASMGGTTSMIVAAEQAVAGVVSMSAPSEFQGHDARKAALDIDEPLLLLASEDDVAARISLVELEDAYGDGVDSEVYTGDAHGTDMLLGEHADAVRDRIFEFLDDHARN